MYYFYFLKVIFNNLFCFFHFRYLHRPVMSGPGLYDPTTIMNSDQMTRATQEGWFKLAFYLLSFFYYLYGMISSLISSA